jgi:tetratricopeptide (TPR) repeat protein
VIDLTTKLRLSSEERDRLLLAAGFRPEEPVEASPEVQPVETAPKIAAKRYTASDAQPTVWTRIPRVGRWTVILGSLILIAALVLLPTGLWRDVLLDLGFEIDVLTVETVWPQVAEADETLVLVGEFANYGGEQIGYNVAGRILEALRVEFREAGLTEVRVDRLPETITDAAAANQRGKEFDAALVVWGEYDSGRVIAITTAPSAEEAIESQERRWLVTTSEELSTTINTDLPKDVQWISLYVLGRVHYEAERWDEAEAVFKKAMDHPLEGMEAVASIYFFLGLLESKKINPDLDTVIANYTEAIEHWPDLVSAWNNRGVAYFHRDAAGDLPRAEADFRQAIALNPKFNSAVLNLALVLLEQDPRQLNEVLSLLEDAESKEPDSAGIQNGLCWYLSLSGNPEDALPHCDRAVKLDPSGYSNDSRGLALALLGRYDEAAKEFQFFLEKLQSEDAEIYQRFASTREAWIETLSVGRNPFDETTLHSLLEE